MELFKVALRYHDLEAVLHKEAEYKEEAQEMAEDEFRDIHHIAYDDEDLKSWVYPAIDPPDDEDDE